jgi:GalNAc5-diNAcBac-PP-undecaprenol beta-1,3-glucosyltransferase
MHFGVLASAPTVTVLLPTHERARTLRLAVACVQEQSVQDYELFIVGDGVADATRAAVAELSAADARIRFFDFQKGPGQGEINRHRALQHARGHFIAYLGDDDWWMPNHLEVLGALLTSMSGAVCRLPDVLVAYG